MVRWLGVVDETTFGTPVTPPTTFLDCQSIGIHPEREAVDPGVSGVIGPADLATGSYKVLGEVEIIPNSTTLLRLLKYLMGTPVSTQDGATARWKHVYKPSDTLKFGTMYKSDDNQPDGANALQYTSVIALDCRLEAALNAYVSARFSLFGQKDAKVAKPTLGTLSTTAQFFSLNGKMYWDITGTLEEANIRAVSLTYKRDVPDDFYSMNDAFLKGFLAGQATLEGSVDLIWKDWVAYEKFWGGSSGPVASPAKAAMSFDFFGPTLGGTGEYTNHRMKWRVPSIVLPSVEEPFEGRDAIIQTVNFQAARGTIDAATHLCAVDLVNEVAGPI